MACSIEMGFGFTFVTNAQQRLAPAKVGCSVLHSYRRGADPIQFR